MISMARCIQWHDLAALLALKICRGANCQRGLGILHRDTCKTKTVIRTNLQIVCSKPNTLVQSGKACWRLVRIRPTKFPNLLCQHLAQYNIVLRGGEHAECRQAVNQRETNIVLAGFQQQLHRNDCRNLRNVFTATSMVSLCF